MSKQDLQNIIISIRDKHYQLKHKEPKLVALIFLGLLVLFILLYKK